MDRLGQTKNVHRVKKSLNPPEKTKLRKTKEATEDEAYDPGKFV